jgi:hypothetical protein
MHTLLLILLVVILCTRRPYPKMRVHIVNADHHGVVIVRRRWCNEGL